MRQPLFSAACIAAALPVATTIPSAALSSEVDGDDHSFLNIQIENDLISGTDRHYSNGFRIAWLSSEGAVPEWARDVAEAVPLFAAPSVKRWSVSLGHSLFTPADTDRSPPDPGDRPYAGWLYGSLGFVSYNDHEVENLELTLGVVGPSAHGESVQNDWHTLIGEPEARGWDDGLKDELGIMLTYERKWRAWREYDMSGMGFSGLGFDVTPHVGVALGNVMTYVAGGAMFRAGIDLPDDYGPPRIRPSLPGTTYFAPSGPFGWYVFAGFEGRAVARNIFLDGNTFEDSARVDKVPLVADFQAGVAVNIGDLRAAYTHVIRTSEFEGQGEPDAFGSLNLTYRF